MNVSCWLVITVATVCIVYTPTSRSGSQPVVGSGPAGSCTCKLQLSPGSAIVTGLVAFNLRMHSVDVYKCFRMLRPPCGPSTETWHARALRRDRSITHHGVRQSLRSVACWSQVDSCRTAAGECNASLSHSSVTAGGPRTTAQPPLHGTFHHLRNGNAT